MLVLLSLVLSALQPIAPPVKPLAGVVFAQEDTIIIRSAYRITEVRSVEQLPRWGHYTGISPDGYEACMVVYSLGLPRLIVVITTVWEVRVQVAGVEE